MTTSADQLAKTKKRIEDSYRSTFKSKPARCRRSFRYSDRRLFRQLKFSAIQAVVTGTTLYVNFLGPSGVTLAAFDGATDSSVETWLRYPVSYRRRMRFFNNIVIFAGSTDEAAKTDEEGSVDKLLGEQMRVFMGTPQEVTWFVELLHGGAEGCVSAAKYTGDDTTLQAKALIAKKVCGSQYRKWTNPTTVDDSWNYLKVEQVVDNTPESSEETPAENTEENNP